MKRSYEFAVSKLTELITWLPQYARQELHRFANELPATQAVRRLSSVAKWLDALSSYRNLEGRPDVQTELVEEFRTAWPHNQIDSWFQLLDVFDQWMADRFVRKEFSNIRYILRKRVGRFSNDVGDVLFSAITELALDSSLDTNDQEGLVKVFRVLSNQRPMASTISGVLSVIPHMRPRLVFLLRRTIDRITRSSRNDVGFSYNDAEALADRRVGPLQQVEDREFVHKLAEAIEALPLPHQQVLRARLSGLTYQMIAQVLGAPMTSVYRIYKEAITKLLPRLPTDWQDKT
jgi:RNA polymerase sigma factor (sigma-70 family)